MSEKTEEFEEEVKIYPPKPGRPTKYIAEYDQVAGNLALAGFSDIDISEALGIAEQTFYDWQNRHPSFKKAISDGKKIAVGVVARSLFERAQGYTVKEKRVERDEVGRDGKPIKNDKTFKAPSNPKSEIKKIIESMGLRFNPRTKRKSLNEHVWTINQDSIKEMYWLNVQRNLKRKVETI